MTSEESSFGRDVAGDHLDPVEMLREVSIFDPARDQRRRRLAMKIHVPRDSHSAVHHFLRRGSEICTDPALPPASGPFFWKQP